MIQKVQPPIIQHPCSARSHSVILDTLVFCFTYLLISLYCSVLLMLRNAAPFLFGRICFAVLVTRKGGKSS